MYYFVSFTFSTAVFQPFIICLQPFTTFYENIIPPSVVIEINTVVFPLILLHATTIKADNYE